ncbi:hypothetical protein Acr_23g0013690 [Actinidia rufa]|uniref:Uncharacterized protein n=1 Tax=Actinidia rufa TaxID=165716 RepID=A0A7J0GQS9_9ERIC|nr:hypothetical protein Acr_23g0013690 [Actinidia rufa]
MYGFLRKRGAVVVPIGPAGGIPLITGHVDPLEQLDECRRSCLHYIPLHCLGAEEVSL